MSGDPQQTLGALLARLTDREHQVIAETQATHEKITQLTALLEHLSRDAEHISITRRTLLDLAETPPAPTPPTALIHQITTPTTDRPPRTRNTGGDKRITLTPKLQEYLVQLIDGHEEDGAAALRLLLHVPEPKIPHQSESRMYVLSDDGSRR